MEQTPTPFEDNSLAKIQNLKYDILDEISETRIYCGFREKMIQVANRPCDVVAMEWPIC